METSKQAQGACSLPQSACNGCSKKLLLGARLDSTGSTLRAHSQHCGHACVLGRANSHRDSACPGTAEQLKLLPLCCGVACRHKHLLFDTEECLRYDHSTCLDKSSPFYQVTRHGLDSIVLRLTEEAKVMTRSNVTVLGPGNPG